MTELGYDYKFFEKHSFLSGQGIFYKRDILEAGETEKFKYIEKET